MTLLLCKLKTQVLNALTKGEVLSDHLISKENVLWELHEAEQWWDRKMDQLATNDEYYQEPQSTNKLMESTDQMMGYAGSHQITVHDDDDDEFVDDELVTMR